MDEPEISIVDLVWNASSLWSSLLCWKGNFNNFLPHQAYQKCVNHNEGNVFNLVACDKFVLMTEFHAQWILRSNKFINESKLFLNPLVVHTIWVIHQEKACRGNGRITWLTIVGQPPTPLHHSHVLPLGSQTSRKCGLLEIYCRCPLVWTLLFRLASQIFACHLD